MSMELIEHIEVGSGGAASIEFTSIPATYTDLLIKISARCTRSGNVSTALNAQFNSSASNYSSRFLLGDGSSAASYTWSTASAVIGYTNGPSATANVFSNHAVYIPNYLSGTNKSISSDSVDENNATFAEQAIVASLWSDSSAITSIKIFEAAGSSNLVEFSSATLYGITAGSDGTTTVS